MKVAKEEQREAKPPKPLSGVSDELFSSLKELRLKLAQDEKVPAFVIFSDAALKDMCAKMPANDDEFLQVSGVGKVKLERYGKVFLGVINKGT